MWNVLAWATASHERALANARAGSTECSRRRVEREEVALYLLDRLTAAHGDDRHTAGSPAGNPARAQVPSG